MVSENINTMSQSPGDDVSEDCDWQTDLLPVVWRGFGQDAQTMDSIIRGHSFVSYTCILSNGQEGAAPLTAIKLVMSFMSLLDL